MKLRTEEGAPRLDRFLTERFPELPRSRWEAWVREGRVAVNGRTVTKGGTRLRAGDEVETEVPELRPPGLHLEPQDLGLPTLYEDNRLWIIDKPAGIVVHPGPGHPGGTVANALLHRLGAGPVDLEPKDSEVSEETEPLEGEDAASDLPEELAPTLWPGLVHRLDRYTTGCLVMAKDREAQTALQAQFKARTVDKRYLAVVRHSRKLPELGSLLVEAPIARHRLERLRMTVSPGGRPAATRVKVLARACGLALVECELLTGRTHQIRVHMSHLGAPILGDPMYGGSTRWLDPDKRALICEHPALHAWSLALDHPGSGERIQVRAPLPQALAELLDRLGIDQRQL